MNKVYNVAYLGAIPSDPNALEAETSYGIRTYNSLSVGKVIDIVQNTHKGQLLCYIQQLCNVLLGVLDDKIFGLSYDRKCEIFYGGRAMMDFSPSVRFKCIDIML